MFDQYTVLVKVALQNEVSKGLLLMGGQFTKLNEQAAAFEARLKNIKALAFVGAGFAAAGFFGIHLFEKALKPAEEYAHQLNIMTMAAFTHKEMVTAIGDAWKNTGNVITSTATQGLSALLDMKNVLGNFEEARKALPLVTKMQAVLQSSTEGSSLASSKTFSQDFAFSVAKALDIVGAVKNKEEFEKQAVLMSQVITAYQGRVTPKMFQSVFAYARQAKLPMNDEFKYRFLPTLMLEYAQSSHGSGGGSRGVGPMIAAMYRFTNQGYINKQSLPLLESLGLATKGNALKTTTTGTTLGHGLKGADLAANDPFMWVQQVLMPAIYKKYGKNLSQQQLANIITMVTRGNQLAGSAFTEFALKPYAFTRDRDIISKAMPVEQAYKQALLNDPMLARQALAAQWENVQIALTTPIVTVLIPALTTLASGLNSLADILIKYPTLAKTLSYAFLGLSGALAFGGTVMLLTAAVKGLALTFEMLAIPVGIISLPVAGIAAALGLIGFAAYKAWNILKGLNWSELWKEVPTGLAMIWNAIKNFVSSIFSGNGMSSTDRQKIGYKGFNADVAKGNTGTKTIQVHSTVQLNKDVIARAVTDHVVNEASKVPNNSSRFDIGMTPTPVMLKLGGY